VAGVADAQAGLAHHIASHGVGERQPFGLDLREHAWIDGLEVEVPDAPGVLADEPRRVSPGAGDVPGVEAETHPFGISVGQEASDLLVGLDVALGVGMEHQAHPGLLAQDAGEMAGPFGQRAPLVRVEFGRLEWPAVGQVAVHRREEHDVAGAERAGQPGNVQHPVPDGRQLRALVQRPANGAAGQAQAAGLELAAQPPRVGRQVAVRAELEPIVSRPGDLIQEPGPGRLAGIAREPHAPGVGSAADSEPRPRLSPRVGGEEIVGHCWRLRSSCGGALGAFP
jgi:hypothetical protein